MIPYVTLPPFDIVGLMVQPFALLVSIGVLTAHLLLIRRAGRFGLSRAWAAEFSLAMVLAGFAGAILFKFLYRPELLADGWLRPRGLPGISSFGGLFGALAGGLLYLAVRRIAWPGRLRFFDAAALAFPFGFAFGRLGCAVMHDHPGRRAAAPWLLSVAYPDGPRYDLGLLELLFLLGLGAAFLFADRLRSWPAGFFPGLLLTAYGLFRAGLDQLHVDPPRYAGFSVDQWSGAGLSLIGAGFLWNLLRSRQSRPL